MGKPEQEEFWYAIECRSRQEGAASAHAESFGLGAYVPMRKLLVREHRHTDKRILKSFPIVSGIVFVNAPCEMTPKFARDLIAPILGGEKLQQANMPSGSDPDLWARMCSSERNAKESPIVGVYGTDGLPEEIPWVQIEYMVHHNRDQDEIQRAKMRGEVPVYPVGSEVRISSGPLEGFGATVVGGLRNKLNVLVHILGNQTKAELSIDQVDAA